MYVNFEYLEEKNLSLKDFLILQIINQMKFEDKIYSKLTEVSELIRLDELESLGYIGKIKGKKDQSEIEKWRLTKEGKKVLNNIEAAGVTEDIIVLFDWIKDVYISEGKEIGNQKRTKMGMAQFAAETGINRNHLAFLLEAFVKDDENMEYNHKLYNVFFNPKDIYSKKFKLDECRLWNYYLKGRDFFDKQFDKIKN